MNQSIYKCFQLKPTEAWYQLSSSEQAALLAKNTKALEDVGGRVVVMCQSGWASEQTLFWGVEEFPNIEAVQKLAQLHAEGNWHRYIQSASVLGMEWHPLI